MKVINSILEGLGDQKKGIFVSEGYGTLAKCPENIDPDKFKKLQTQCKKSGYILSGFNGGKVNGSYIGMDLQLDPVNNQYPLIQRSISAPSMNKSKLSFGTFLVHPNVMKNMTKEELTQYIKNLQQAQNLCDFLNEEDFTSYVISEYQKE